MLYAIAVILLIMWLLGLLSGYTLGAFVQLLLVIAVVLFLAGLLRCRRIVTASRVPAAHRRRPLPAPIGLRDAATTRSGCVISTTPPSFSSPSASFWRSRVRSAPILA